MIKAPWPLTFRWSKVKIPLESRTYYTQNDCLYYLNIFLPVTPLFWSTWWYRRPEMISLFTCKHTSDVVKILWQVHLRVTDAAFRLSCRWARVVTLWRPASTCFLYVFLKKTTLFFLCSNLEQENADVLLTISAVSNHFYKEHNTVVSESPRVSLSSWNSKQI